MEKDLDIKLYKEYLDGEKGDFELLYNKYKDKIQYFVYNIVKDYQKAEDITQDVFIYVMQNRMKEGYTFKYYIYLVSKSRAYNQINMEKRRTEINEEYILNGVEQVGQDVADIVTKNEKRQEIISSIDMLDDRYKNAIYLVKIEELTYQETAPILGESIQNVKNLIHRGKKELRKILIKKGFDEINKVEKVIIAILCISILLAGGVYATMKIIESFTGKAEITPTYTSKLSTMDSNKVWVGTFNLVWNDFMNYVVKGKVEFEENYKEIKKQQSNYSGKNTFEENDILRIPFIKVNDEINYDELCWRKIKNNNYYIKQALQTIDFELNNVGGSVKSEAVIDATNKAWTEKPRKMIFDSDFILYLKEESKEQSYFALKVDNTDILIEGEINVE